jgi:hypothetical protein
MSHTQTASIEDTLSNVRLFRGLDQKVPVADRPERTRSIVRSG